MHELLLYLLAVTVIYRVSQTILLPGVFRHLHNHLEFCSQFFPAEPSLLTHLLNGFRLCNVDVVTHFYRAMHFSAYARSWDRMSSVRPSVRPSVRL